MYITKFSYCIFLGSDEARVKEFNLKKMWLSPNGTLFNFMSVFVFVHCLQTAMFSSICVFVAFFDFDPSLNCRHNSQLLKWYRVPRTYFGEKCAASRSWLETTKYVHVVLANYLYYVHACSDALFTVIIGRHAFGDQYRATDLVIPGTGIDEWKILVFHSEHVFRRVSYRCGQAHHDIYTCRRE